MSHGGGNLFTHRQMIIFYVLVEMRGRVLQTVFAENNLYARETVSCQV